MGVLAVELSSTMRGEASLAGFFPGKGVGGPFVQDLSHILAWTCRGLRPCQALWRLRFGSLCCHDRFESFLFTSRVPRCDSAHPTDGPNSTALPTLLSTSFALIENGPPLPRHSWLASCYECAPSLNPYLALPAAQNASICQLNRSPKALHPNSRGPLR